MRNNGWRSHKSLPNNATTEVPTESTTKTLDIYGKGVKTRQKWEGITNDYVNNSQLPYIVRNISSVEKRRFRKIIRETNMRRTINAFLNLPRYLNGREKWIWGFGFENERNDNTYLATTQFYRGAFARSFATLLGKMEKERPIGKEDALQLFPRIGKDWKLPLVAASPPPTRLVSAAEVKAYSPQRCYQMEGLPAPLDCHTKS